MRMLQENERFCSLKRPRSNQEQEESSRQRPTGDKSTVQAASRFFLLASYLLLTGPNATCEGTTPITTLMTLFTTTRPLATYQKSHPRSRYGGGTSATAFLLLSSSSSAVPSSPPLDDPPGLSSTTTTTVPLGETDLPLDQRRHHHNNNKVPKSRVKELFRNAKDLERRGLWRQASRILNEILRLDPTDAHSHLALARLEARRSSSSSPRREKDASSSSSSLTTADAASASSTARAAFLRGTRACPDSVHLWQAWAVYEESLGHIDEARQLYERALQVDPGNPYVCHAYGLMEHSLQRTQEARLLWERALQRTSTAALVCSLGQLLISEKKFQVARQLYARHLPRLKTEREKTEVYLASAWLEERYFQSFDRAEELIRQSLFLCPTSSVAQVALARLEGRRQEYHHGGEEVRSAKVRHLATTCLGTESGALDKQPADGRVFNAWAHMEVKSKRYASARKILLKGMKRYPKDHTLLQAAGKVEERLGNYSGARDLYSASLCLQPSAPTLVAYAMLEMRHPEGDSFNFTRVKRLFEEALLVDPRHGPSYNAFARAIFEKEGQEEEARKLFERGIRANCPDVASIYHGYARLEIALGHIERARELLLNGINEAKRHDMGMDSPHRERAQFLTHTLGMLDLNSNRPNDAKSVFKAGIDHYGNSSQLLLGAALCEVKLGNEENARLLFERAVLSDEKHAHAWQAWGVMEMKAGNLKTAKTLFECGVKSAPHHGALWQAYATMESRLGRFESARSLFERGVRRAPKHVALYQGWATLELRAENYNTAKGLIGQALTLDKRNGPGWIVAAAIEEKLGNEGLAILLLRRGIECSPASPELYRSLGEALLRRGRIQDAREIFERGIEVDPTHAPLYHSLAELEARVCNLEGLAKLHKRTKAIFHTNALKPIHSSSDVWAARIRAGRNRDISKGVAALAERVVEEESTDPLSISADLDFNDLTVPFSSDFLSEGLLDQLLAVDETPLLDTGKQEIPTSDQII